MVSAVLSVLIAAAPAADAPAPKPWAEGLTRETLEGYLSRSITMLDLLTFTGEVNENIRMLENVGARFAGRGVYVWGGEDQLAVRLEAARENAARIHEALPDLILQACAFEIVSARVGEVTAPGWALHPFGLGTEPRPFRYEDMVYPGGQGRDQWGRGASVPDISRPETQAWFYYLARSYIDAGCEAIHFGQVEIMGGNDPDHAHWDAVIAAVRIWAKDHARRGWVLCDGHVPSGGLRRGERLLLDFHSFPLRVKETPGRPREGVLEVGFIDSFYGRSRGGVTPSGWSCQRLPYLAEVDNWGVSDRPGEPGLGGCWVWGWDEISWFAHQDEAYRNQWLRYAWDWVREHDPNGWLQMPGSRCLHAPVDGLGWYRANRRSGACPEGFGQEETIRAVWAGARLSGG